jgi:ribonuclease D
MSATQLPAPLLVTQPAELEALVEKLSQEPFVAVDTEANSLFAYQEQVCLIQFSIPEQDFLVDPLALDDLSPLSTIFCDPNIEKIFHAAEYDLIIMKHDFDFEFVNLFDTMLAARILGIKSVGLSSILKEQFGVVANKKYQRADWGRRPLIPEMLAYAQLDTHFLIPIRDQMKSKLIDKGRWDLAIEDFTRVCQATAIQTAKKGNDCWRIHGVRDLQPYQVSILNELCAYRDQKAQSSDRPLFKVISDRTLVNISMDGPETMRELERVPGVSPKQARWIGKGLLSAVRRGLKTNPPKPPRRVRPSDQFLNRYDNLKRWRKNTAQKMRVESDVILPKNILSDLATNNPQTKTELHTLLATVPWRRDHLGDEIFKVLKASR